jgi:hypothetical protein
VERKGYGIFKVTSVALSGDTEEKHKRPFKAFCTPTDFRIGSLCKCNFCHPRNLLGKYVHGNKLYAHLFILFIYSLINCSLDSSCHVMSNDTMVSE